MCARATWSSFVTGCARATSSSPAVTRSGNTTIPITRSSRARPRPSASRKRWSRSSRRRALRGRRSRTWPRPSVPRPRPEQPGMEVWGGIECSYVRVHDARFDQLARSGHYGRMDDLERFAALGLKTLRYPLLWETAVTGARKAYDFRFADERVPRLRQLGIRIIAGLVHHGSGPDHAPVTSDRFAEGLAHYAG